MQKTGIFLLAFLLMLPVQTQAQAQESRMPAYPVQAVETSLSKPDMTEREILDWAVEAAVAGLTFNHADYQERFKRSAGYFTEAGWKNFAQGLMQAQLLDVVVDQKRSLIAAPAGKAVLLQEGLANEAYGWHVVVPLTIISTNEAEEETRQRLNISLLIVRSDVNKDGRGIQNWAQVAAQ
ncbi:MAG: DotI/IcmL family type IV secretion protein [Bdellovibrionales bacterium]|jgi:hypothetical protein|nr:DotI/IcmL family type IV secretion protein [Bdellovibrionales bacterium]